MLFSHVKISSFRAKAHLVFHWCLYNNNNNNNNYNYYYYYYYYYIIIIIIIIIIRIRETNTLSQNSEKKTTKCHLNTFLALELKKGMMRICTKRA